MPKIIHTGQAVVDINFQVPRLPERGGDVYASTQLQTVGGAYNTIYAAVSQGASVLYAGGTGTGPNGDFVRQQLAQLRVPWLHTPCPNQDTGSTVVLIEPDGERSFVSVRGAETHRDRLAHTPVSAQDTVIVTGYSLLDSVTATPLVDWLCALNQTVYTILDPGPLVQEIPPELLARVLKKCHLVTLNEREFALLCEQLQITAQNTHAALQTLATQIAADLVLRTGASGAHIARYDTGSVITVPTLTVEVLDTNGAGDTHLGVLAAYLTAGKPLKDAVQAANIAASLAVTKFGGATCPSRAQLETALADFNRQQRLNQ